MGWNYRVLAYEDNNEIHFKVHEVYYGKDGKPNGYSSKKVTICGENLDDIEWTLNETKEALKKTILWSGDKFPSEYK